MIYFDNSCFKIAQKVSSRLLFISNPYPLPQLGRLVPVVVQNAFGLLSPEFPLQGL